MSLNRYKEIEYEEESHRDPAETLDEMASLDAAIASDVVSLKELLA